MKNLDNVTVYVKKLGKTELIKISTEINKLKQINTLKTECPMINSDSNHPITCVHVYRFFPGKVHGNENFNWFFENVCCQYPSVCPYYEILKAKGELVI